MKRSKQREALMQMIYHMGANEDFSEESKVIFCRQFLEDGEGIDYLEKVYPFLAGHIEEIDKKIKENSTNWKFDRIDKVDLAILRLAVAELMYMAEITPSAVAINEAVELGKNFGTEDSGKFINGILGNIWKSIAPSA